jgi:hypothetical protein
MASTSWTGEVPGKIQYHGSSWYLQYSSYFHFRRGDGGNTFYGDDGGNTWSIGSSRAPIFYDSNDTGYYTNPNGSSYLNSLSVIDGNLQLYKSQTVDMSNTGVYSTSNYYPVIMGVPTSGVWIEIQNNLNSNVPSWSTHGSGFTLNLRWWTNGSGWGTTEIKRRVEQYHERFTNSTICGGITQMSNGSVEVVWLRGGGTYYFKFSRDVSASAQSSTYTNNGQSVSPTSSAQNTVWNSATGDHVSYNNSVFTYARMDAPIFYDYNDTGYYCDPSSQSILYYTSVNVGQEAPGGANSSSAGLVLRGNYNTNTWAHKFHKYDNGSGVPLYLSTTVSTNAWSAKQAWGNGLNYDSQIFGSLGVDSAVYSPIFYDSNNTGYYVDPSVTSSINALYMVGPQYINYSNPTIYLQDTDHRSAMIHCNSNIFYILRGSGVNATGWATYNGYWPLEINLENNSAMFGGTLEAISDMRAPIFYDRNDTGYYSDQASTSRYNYVVPNKIKVVNNVNNEPRWDFSAYVVEAQHWYGNNSSMTMYMGEGNPINTYNLRSDIYYDRDNTGYYVNPASTSNLYNIVLPAQTGGLVVNGSSSTDTANASTWYGIGGSSVAGHSGTGYNMVQVAGYYGLRLRSNSCILDLDGPSYGINWTYLNANLAVGGQSRASVFYDVDNTTYYADFASTGTSIQAAGNITAYYSDERLKTKLGKIENAVDKVMMLEGFYYEANETAQKLGYKPKREVGVSAQDVQRVLPEIVAQAPISAEYLTIDYERLTPLLIEAIKELKAEIEELKKWH